MQETSRTSPGDPPRDQTPRRPSRDYERASDGVCSAANLDTYAGTHTDTGEMRMQIHAETSTGADTHRGTGADIDTDTETDTETGNSGALQPAGLEVLGLNLASR